MALLMPLSVHDGEAYIVRAVHGLLEFTALVGMLKGPEQWAHLGVMMDHLEDPSEDEEYIRFIAEAKKFIAATRVTEGQ